MEQCTVRKWGFKIEKKIFMALATCTLFSITSATVAPESQDSGDFTTNGSIQLRYRNDRDSQNQFAPNGSNHLSKSNFLMYL